MTKDDFSKLSHSPNSSFYFEMKFDARPDMDSSFQEVSGLQLVVGTKEVRQGGGNSFVHKLPTEPKYDNLVLKRCLMLNANLNKWCKDALEDFEFKPLNLTISLQGVNGGSLASWNIEGAYPISWELSTLSGTSNELAIETLELKYRHFKRER